MPATILIVDADPYAAHVTRAIAARTIPGAVFEIAATPEVARASVELGHPDMLIIDPSPHSPAAGELIAALKQRWPDIRVLVLTAAPTPLLRRTMRNLGVDAYLEKPVPLPRLAEELRTVLEPSTRRSASA